MILLACKELLSVRLCSGSVSEATWFASQHCNSIWIGRKCFICLVWFMCSVRLSGLIIWLSQAETMIKLFKVKEKQREIAENANGKPPVKKQSPGELRLHKGCLLRDQCPFILFLVLLWVFLIFIHAFVYLKGIIVSLIFWVLFLYSVRSVFILRV